MSFDMEDGRSTPKGEPIDRQAILDEIIRLTAPPVLEADEFTIEQYLKRQKEQGHVVPYNTAHNRLSALVAKGVLTMRKVVYRDQERNAYRFVDDHKG